ncbi:MAG: SEC-C metal-binding domain-containing protein [Chitinophagaceae bacterium]|nr:SEC-C metal-binding domain-containing protein [Chitinophagaceae bacterium]
MKKIGRNDPCPCGSGKKYKQCHLKEQDDLADTTQKITKSPTINFNDLLASRNSVQMLGLLSALQLHPENHGRNFRFEQLCRTTLLQFDPNDKKPPAMWETLKEVIQNYTNGELLEDSLSSAFTEIAVFEQGNYIVYPGIYDGFTVILNQLTECIFLHKHTLHEHFIKKVHDAVGLLLFMSNSVAHKAGHVPFIYQEGTTGNIEFPPHGVTTTYTDAIVFDRTNLKEVCDEHNYDMAILDEFTVQPGADELRNDNPDENVVNYKPIVVVGDDFILYMPTGILNSLITYAYQKAKEYNCYDELMNLLYERQFYLTCRTLEKTEWLATDIELPELQKPLPVRETVFQFDNQKLAYICYVKTGEQQSLDEKNLSTSNSNDPYEDRTLEVIQYLSTLNPKQPFGIFCLYIIGETGNNHYFMWSKPSAGNQSLALKYRELWAIIHSSNVNSLTLWKFAKCYSRTNELARIMSMGGPMDAYAIYRKNAGSLLHSDEANPVGGVLMIVNGNSNDFRREVQKQQNEHAIPIFYKEQLAYAKVRRYKDYAPIYIEEELSRYFRIVIESYKMPIWVINQQTKPSRESWGTYVCEAVAFWLNKMEPLLAPYLNKQTFIQFELEIVVDEQLMEARQFEIKSVPLEDIKLIIEINAPTIRIIMPFEYIYAVMLSDNRADRILMDAVLNGIVNYIKAAGTNTELNSDIIDEIIDQILQPPGAKMLLFSDTSTNIKMDDRNLPPIRYITDTDISYILDNLVSYLPKGYVVSEHIPDKKDRIKLCDDVVTALATQITTKLAIFNGPELLQWLIKLNEKCIHFRELKEIVIPAKIACFSNFETEVQQLLDGEKNLVTTAHAIRTLIEFVATNIPTGNRWPNFDDIDELLALTNQLTEWGALSEAMRMGIDDPKMGLLPSGRIGIDKTIEREAFKPYAIARTESTLFKDIEEFEKNYVPAKKTGNAVETEESKLLDTAFKAEFGLTLTILSKIVGSLVNEGFINAKSCMEIEEINVKDILSRIEGISGNNINTSLNLLTLLERESIAVPPAGYCSLDIFPWRYNRPISYIRRPLVKVIKNDTLYYYYGYRHLTQFIDNLFYLLFSSKLPGAKSDRMKSWLATASGKKGNPYRKAVKTWFDENSNYEVIPYEVQMKPGVSKEHIEAEKDYGDIDLLVIDHGNRIIYPIECKNIQGGRNVHEIKVEMDEYLGRDGKDKDAKMRKHVERTNWLNANKKALINLVPDADSYTIKSFILTADEIFLGYLKKDILPLPVKSFAFLRKNGLSYLKDF